jgi:hypothetical protein
MKGMVASIVHHAACEEASLELVDERVAPGDRSAGARELRRVLGVVELPAVACGADGDLDCLG